MSADATGPGTGRFSGKVALVTGAGRGQGRSHALRLAEEGADLALLDLGAAGEVSDPAYPLATTGDLAEVQALVREQGRRAVALEVDVRDPQGLAVAAATAARELGGIDLVVANAGVTDGSAPAWELPVERWRTVVDINLSGAFYTCRAAIPHLLARGRGGALVLVGSGVAIKAVPGLAHYVAAKAGVRGLAAALAHELGPHGIRCNSVHPGGVGTGMTDAMSLLGGTPRTELLAGFRARQLIQEDLSPEDVTAAVLWLLSDEARLVTGMEMTVDAGETRA
jgi:SDR family mycofactocin-dependent oxidoreductase